ncbi:MAG: efflux RND transporter periplasmic adaptor subunit [Fischerella sp.]|jgi:multidrug efflux pump subunit AcrA (membrane-fusion protein)|nr:efflux RND transporter periplasmic adaptor subunit [Fischerella sp.]
MIWNGNQPRKIIKNHSFSSCSSILLLAFLSSLGLLMGSCGSLPKESAEAQQERRGAAGQAGGATPVDVAIARESGLQQQLEYRGITKPYREVSLRSQVEGRLVALNVDEGDTLRLGQNYLISCTYRINSEKTDKEYKSATLEAV